MDIEAMDMIRVERDFAVFWSKITGHAVNFSHANTMLDMEEFVLVPMEVHGRSVRPLGTIDELPQRGRDRAFHVQSVGLTHHKTSTRWWLQELNSKEATKSAICCY